MSELDLKVLNLLTNNKSDLREFVLSSSENVFDKEYRRFVKHMIRYYHSFNSCPSLDALIETAGQNANLEEYVIDVWKEIEEQDVDKRDFKLLISKLQKRHNARLINDLIADLDRPDADEEEGSDIDEQNTKLIKAYNEIRALGEQKAYKVVTLRDSAEDWAMNFRARQTNPELSKGTFTGFSVLDHYTYGIRPTELWLIAGDTGGGKSIMLINLAKNMWMGENEFPESGKQLKESIDNNSWKTGNDILFVTLEMPESEVQDRIQSAMCDIDSLNLMKGKITKEEGKRLAIALKFRQTFPYDMQIADVPRGCSMAQIQHIYDETCLSLGKKIKVVLIDYLGLMADSGEDSDADWEKLKNIAEQMHEFARVNDVAVITAVQVKTSKPGEGGIGLHRIGRCSMIMHNVNLGLQIENREDEENRPDAIVHCIKFRRGPKFIMNNLRKAFMYTKLIDEGFKEDKETGSTGEDLTDIMGQIFVEEENEEGEKDE